MKLAAIQLCDGKMRDAEMPGGELQRQQTGQTNVVDPKAKESQVKGEAPGG